MCDAVDELPAPAVDTLHRATSTLRTAVHIAGSVRKVAGVLEPPINLEEPLCTGVFELHADALTKAVRWLCSVVHEQQGTLQHIDNSLVQLQEECLHRQQLVERNHELVLGKIEEVQVECDSMVASGAARATMSPTHYHKFHSELSEVREDGMQAVGSNKKTFVAGSSITGMPSTRHPSESNIVMAGMAAAFIAKTRERLLETLAEKGSESDDSSPESEASPKNQEHRPVDHMAERKSMEEMEELKEHLAHGDASDLSGLPVAILALHDTFEALEIRVMEMEKRDGAKDALRSVKKDLESHKRWQHKMEQQLEHQERTQQQKDLAQDELLKMEMNAMKQAIQSRMSVADFERAREAVLSRSEENARAIIDKLKTDLAENIATVHEQTSEISRAATNQIQLLDQMINENVKQDGEREAEVETDLADIRKELSALKEALNQSAAQHEEEKELNIAALIKRIESLEKQSRRQTTISADQGEANQGEAKNGNENPEAAAKGKSSRSPRSPRSPRQTKHTREANAKIETDFASLKKQLQDEFSKQIADLKLSILAVTEAAGGDEMSVSTRGESRGRKGSVATPNPAGSSSQGSRAATAKLSNRKPGSRDSGIETQSPDSLSWLADKMQRFANDEDKKKEREKQLLETLQKLLPELEQMPQMIEKVTKLHQEVEELADINKELTSTQPVALEIASEIESAGSKPATAFSKQLSRIGTGYSNIPGLNALENGHANGVNVQEELERFRRLFEYLESVVPKDAQKAMHFFLGKEWRSGDKPDSKSAVRIESESRLESKLQLTEDSMRREVGNVMNVVKNTQRDTLATSERLDKLERLVPGLMSNVEHLRRQAQTQSFPPFFVAERMASRERSSTASHESRRGTPTHRMSSGGLLDSEPRLGTPGPGAARLSTPHPFVSQRGLGEGLESLRSDVRAWLETLRNGLMSLLQDKADSSQVHSLAAQIAAAEDQLQVSSMYVKSLDVLSSRKLQTTSSEESAFLRKQFNDGPRICASCDTPLSTSAGEWRVVTPATSHSRFPLRALPDLPRTLGTGLMPKTASLPKLQTTADRSRTAG